MLTTLRMSLAHTKVARSPLCARHNKLCARKMLPEVQAQSEFPSGQGRHRDDQGRHPDDPRFLRGPRHLSRACCARDVGQQIEAERDWNTSHHVPKTRHWKQPGSCHPSLRGISRRHPLGRLPRPHSEGNFAENRQSRTSPRLQACVSPNIHAGPQDLSARPLRPLVTIGRAPRFLASQFPNCQHAT